MQAFLVSHFADLCQFHFFRIVEDTALFFDIGEKVFARVYLVIDELDIVVDKAHTWLGVNVAGDCFFDFGFSVGIDVFRFGDDENVVIASVLVGNAILNVDIINIVSPCVASKE